MPKVNTLYNQLHVISWLNIQNIPFSKSISYVKCADVVVNWKTTEIFSLELDRCLQQKVTSKNSFSTKTKSFY